MLWVGIYNNCTSHYFATSCADVPITASALDRLVYPLVKVSAVSSAVHEVSNRVPASSTPVVVTDKSQ